MPRHRRILVADSSKYFDNSIWHRLIPETEFEIVGQAGDPDQIVKMAKHLSPDIILVDLSHPENCGLQTVTTLHTVHPDIPIITLMPISSYEYTRASLDAGATACLIKSEIVDLLLQTLRNLVPAQSSVSVN